MRERERKKGDFYCIDDVYQQRTKGDFRRILNTQNAFDSKALFVDCSIIYRAYMYICIRKVKLISSCTQFDFKAAII